MGDGTDPELDEYYVEIDVVEKIKYADMQFHKNDTLRIEEMDVIQRKRDQIYQGIDGDNWYLDYMSRDPFFSYIVQT